LAVASKVHAQSDVFIDPAGCSVIDAEGSTVPAPEGVIVITNNQKNICMGTCRATIPNPTRERIVWNSSNTGTVCVISGCGQTASWQEIISPSGRAHIHCHINPGNP